jgi:hypothetical protein
MMVNQQGNTFDVANSIQPCVFFTERRSRNESAIPSGLRFLASQLLLFDYFEREAVKMNHYASPDYSEHEEVSFFVS